MLCLECGAEMRLVQVTEDTTMFVSGYEHHTWQCSGCSTTERRMIFTREKTPTPSVTIEPTHTMRAKPAQTVPIEPTSVQSAQAAPVETTVQDKASQTDAVETTQEVPVQPTIQTLPLRANAWVKAVEKLHERETAERKAAEEAKRSAEFKVFWDNLRFWIAGCTDTPAAPTPFRSLSLGGFPLVNLLGCFHPGIRR